MRSDRGRAWGLGSTDCVKHRHLVGMAYRLLSCACKKKPIAPALHAHYCTTAARYMQDQLQGRPALASWGDRKRTAMSTG